MKIPNETEATLLLGIEVTGFESAKKEAEALSKMCPGTILITMGEHGVLTLAKGDMDFAKAIQEKTIDTTAAGDTFIGALATLLVGRFFIYKLDS